MRDCAERIRRLGEGHAAFRRVQPDKGCGALLRRTWANDLKDREIRVNVVSPTAIDTPALDGSIGNDGQQARALKDGLAAQVPR